MSTPKWEGELRVGSKKRFKYLIIFSFVVLKKDRVRIGAYATYEDCCAMLLSTKQLLVSSKVLFL